MTKQSVFPTKKSMVASKNIADIPQCEMDKFLTGAKDTIIDSKPLNKEPSTTNVGVNVNVDVDVNNAIASVGRASTFEKTFKRQTYYVHNDLIKQIDKLAKKGTKGAKTKIINTALKEYIDNLS